MHLDNHDLKETIFWGINIFPNDHKYLTFLKKVFRHEFRKNGFRRISTPFFGEKKYFEQVFQDKFSENVLSLNLDNDMEVCLNPLPSIFNLRAYIQEEQNYDIKPIYNYFMGTYFPKNWENNVLTKQLFGWDVIWENDVIIDIQNLFIVSNILNKIWLQWKYEIFLNFTWNKKEIDKYKQKLWEFYADKQHLLTDDGLKNLENDILKLLSSSDEDEQILAKSAPKIEKCYKKDSKKDLGRIKQYLKILQLDYTYDDKLFWFHQFNDWVIWKIKLSSSDTVLASWYWYNELSNILWENKEIPWSWFWVDAFEIVDILKQSSISIKNKDKLDLFFVQLWDEAKKVVMPLSLKAREAWINTAVSLWTPSMKEQMLKATRSWARYVVMVWVMEAKNLVFQVRNIILWTQEEVKKDDLIDYIIDKIWKESLDFYDPSRDLLEN